MAMFQAVITMDKVKFMQVSLMSSRRKSCVPGYFFYFFTFFLLAWYDVCSAVLKFQCKYVCDQVVSFPLLQTRCGRRLVNNFLYSNIQVAIIFTQLNSVIRGEQICCHIAKYWVKEWSLMKNCIEFDQGCKLLM